MRGGGFSAAIDADDENECGEAWGEGLAGEKSEELFFDKREDLVGGEVPIFPAEGADLVDEFSGCGGAEVGLIEELFQAIKGLFIVSIGKNGADFLGEGRGEFLKKCKHSFERVAWNPYSIT